LVYSKDGAELQQWYKRDWESFDHVKDNETDIAQLRKGLEDAVHRQHERCSLRSFTFRRLDSSVISAITAKFARQRIESGDTQEAWYPRFIVLVGL
jgi:asparagine synthase (glutamine-hydrolysing)